MDIHIARELALSMPDAEERDHFGNPSYRVKTKGDRVFMTQQIEAHTAVLMLNVEQQAELHAHHPTCFIPHPSKWGEKGATLVMLDVVSEKVFRPALEIAWRSALPHIAPGTRRKK